MEFTLAVPVIILYKKQLTLTIREPYSQQTKKVIIIANIIFINVVKLRKFVYKYIFLNIFFNYCGP